MQASRARGGTGCAGKKPDQRKPWGYSAGAPQQGRRSASGSASSGRRSSQSPAAGRRSASPAAATGRRVGRAPEYTGHPKYEALPTADLLRAVRELNVKTHNASPPGARCVGPAAPGEIGEHLEASTKPKDGYLNGWPVSNQCTPYAVTGSSKGVFISATYADTDWALPTTDAMYALMMALHNAGFIGEKRMVAENLAYAPTRQTVLEVLAWLAADAQPGDTLLLAMSGHAANIAGRGGAANTGFAPIDWTVNGVLTEEDMHTALLAKLPAGVRLTCVFDIAHGGVVIGMPRVFEASKHGFDEARGASLPTPADVWTLSTSHATPPPTVPAGELTEAVAAAIASATPHTALAMAVGDMVEFLVKKLSMHPEANPIVALGASSSSMSLTDPFSVGFPTGTKQPAQHAPQVSKATTERAVLASPAETVERSSTATGSTGPVVPTEAVEHTSFVLSAHTAAPQPTPYAEQTAAGTDGFAALPLSRPREANAPTVLPPQQPSPWEVQHGARTGTCTATPAIGTRVASPRMAVERPRSPLRQPRSEASAAVRGGMSRPVTPAPAAAGGKHVVGGALKALVVGSDDGATRPVARFLARQGFAAETRTLTTSHFAQEDVWWLVDDAQPGDSLFFALEVDNAVASAMSVDAIKDVLTSNLPHGCRLTWVVECVGPAAHPLLYQYIVPQGTSAVTQPGVLPSRGVLLCVSGGEGTTAGYISAMNRNPELTARELIALVCVMMTYQVEGSASPRGGSVAPSVQLGCSRKLGLSSAMHLGVLPSEAAQKAPTAAHSNPPQSRYPAPSTAAAAPPAPAVAEEPAAPPAAPPPASPKPLEQPQLAQPDSDSTPGDVPPAPAGEDYPLLLTDFCHAHLPGKLPMLPQLLARNRGQERALCDTLAEEAGVAGYFEARERVLHFYRRVNPAKTGRVDAILAEYTNSWGELYEDLAERYGEPVDVALTAGPPSTWPGRQPDFDASLPHQHPPQPTPPARHLNDPSPSAPLRYDQSPPRPHHLRAQHPPPTHDPAPYGLHHPPPAHAHQPPTHDPAPYMLHHPTPSHQLAPPDPAPYKAYLAASWGGVAEPNPMQARFEEAIPSREVLTNGVAGHPKRAAPDGVLRPLVSDPDFAGRVEPPGARGLSGDGLMGLVHAPSTQGPVRQAEPQDAHRPEGGGAQRRMAAEEMYKALKQDADTYSQRVQALREAVHHQQEVDGLGLDRLT
eukprot:TRINITY_DN9962_c0_g1_i2.p1 TRINITY_DN9962_c0_g1~~TRINITY_DN9962_c0_g1_i2.p1  ORF type:complete len:1208 (+),score=232.47 TRINITY_DN9962_c0_g1_i2:111-3734(+)